MINIYNCNTYIIDLNRKFTEWLSASFFIIFNGGHERHQGRFRCLPCVTIWPLKPFGYPEAERLLTNVRLHHPSHLNRLWPKPLLRPPSRPVRLISWGHVHVYLGIRVIFNYVQYAIEYCETMSILLCYCVCFLALSLGLSCMFAAVQLYSALLAQD